MRTPPVPPAVSCWADPTAPRVASGAAAVFSSLDNRSFIRLSRWPIAVIGRAPTATAEAATTAPGGLPAVAKAVVLLGLATGLARRLASNAASRPEVAVPTETSLVATAELAATTRAELLVAFVGEASGLPEASEAAMITCRRTLRRAANHQGVLDDVIGRQMAPGVDSQIPGAVNAAEGQASAPVRVSELLLAQALAVERTTVTF